MRFEDTVLARRFTIICLIAAIFGMGFANLVINKPAYAYKHQVTKGCVLKIAAPCQWQQ